MFPADNSMKFIRIVLFVSLLLAVGCSGKKTIGNPYILYEIHGVVTDADDNPLEGIEVYSADSEKDVTSVNGEFVIFGRSVPSSFAKITCEDKDGEDNGGEFMRTTQSIELRLRSAGNGNNKGNYFASGVTVRMLLKDDELQDDINPPLPS